MRGHLRDHEQRQRELWKMRPGVPVRLDVHERRLRVQRSGHAIVRRMRVSEPHLHERHLVRLVGLQRRRSLRGRHDHRMYQRHGDL